MSMPRGDAYGARFYEGQQDGSARSAERVLPLVFLAGRRAPARRGNEPRRGREPGHRVRPCAFRRTASSARTCPAPFVWTAAGSTWPCPWRPPGSDHRNEQWPAYWRDRFGRWGYVLVDCLRSRSWDDPEVEPWYA
ncbi:hypothetical protein MTF65_29820 [Streptomyces sp. APSN-46.1]|uniref:hypothetical protein n=1 Tax=Streptomyces sp. APSN-46.1 TaxID=2929049 RepID=UPI001FB22497|nr:hypothetical protein [Streptomyces sp. APSN-46.1]MCJ1681479.1 hypothetical protein [Streptomyces sp. APSN-46.1]